MGADPGRGLIGFEVVAGEVAAAFRPALAAGGFDQDAAHRLGGGGEEVPTAVPAMVVGSSDQPKVRLMNQGGGLEGVFGRFAGHAHTASMRSSSYTSGSRSAAAWRSPAAAASRRRVTSDIRLSVTDGDGAGDGKPAAEPPSVLSPDAYHYPDRRFRRGLHPHKALLAVPRALQAAAVGGMSVCIGGAQIPRRGKCRPPSCCLHRPSGKKLHGVENVVQVGSSCPLDVSGVWGRRSHPSITCPN